MVKQTFAPVLISAHWDDENGQFPYTIVSDVNKELKNCTVTITEHRFDSKDEHPMWIQRVDVPLIEAQKALKMKPFHKSWYCEELTNCFVRFTLKDSNDRIISQEEVWPKYLKDMKFTQQVPNLKYTVLPAHEADEHYLEDKFSKVTIQIENAKDGSSVPSIFTSFTLDKDISSRKEG